MLRIIPLLLFVPFAFADEPTAATVNGEAIRLADVDSLFNKLKPPGVRTAEQVKLLRESVLDDLIDELLLKQHLAKQTQAPAAKEIDKHIEALAAVQKEQGKALADFLRDTGLTEKRLRESFDTTMRLQSYFESRTQEADYRKYFEANRDAFEGTTVRVSHILLRFSTDGEGAAAREKLRTLKTEIESGRLSFADAARQHSICITAKRGGDLGTITRHDAAVDESLAAAVFALKIGAVSEPLRTGEGWHVVTATKRTPGPAKSYESCKDAVKDAFLDDARTRMVAELKSAATIRKVAP